MTESSAHPDAALMNGVIPYLAMAGRAAEACDFYARAFAARELGRMPMPEGKPGLMHAQIAINDGVVMMSDGGCDDPSSYAFGHLQLVVGDGRAWWDRAVAAGCTVLTAYECQFWGDDWGLLQDPFGIRWAILQPGSQA